MPELRPFRGIRYNQEAVGDISLVVTPPYDVISQEERDFYYNRHPYNVIRLILNRKSRTDKDENAPYKRAAEFFSRWFAQRILIRDSIPGIYIYRQRYILESEYKECTGLVARVRLEEFGNSGILPHEEIMPKPFKDRMKLLEKTMASFDLVHSLYSDPEEKLKEPILGEMERFPICQFQTKDGIAHDIWLVNDENFIRKVIRFFKKKKLYIADGHHRYQTALEYSKRILQSGTGQGEDDPRHFIAMMIVEMENPGLSVLPVHRVVLKREIIEHEALIRLLERWFYVSEVEVPRGARSGQVYHLLNLLKKTGEEAKAFGVFLHEPDKFLLLVWRQENDPERVVEGEYSNLYKNLDVTVLHKVVFEKALGIPGDRDSVEKNIMFTRDPLEAVKKVESGSASIVFFLNPTKIEQVRELADKGERMPQKSTYFYPKPFSGVIMSKITEW